MNWIVLAVVVALLLAFAYYLTADVLEYVDEIDCRLSDLERVVDDMRKRQEDDGK